MSLYPAHVVNVRLRCLFMDGGAGGPVLLALLLCPFRYHSRQYHDNGYEAATSVGRSVGRRRV